MAIEDILKVGGFDIETKEWWTSNPTIYMIGLATDKGDYVLDLFKKVDVPEIKSTLMDRTAKRISFDNENQLRYYASLMMQDLDLHVWGGQFVQYFDIKQLQKKKDKLFIPSVDNSEPSYTGASIPFQSFGLNDSLMIDTWDFARNFFSMFLSDNKIETITSFCSKFYDVIFKYVKAETYGEQRELVIKAEEGDRDAAYRLCQYNYDDTIMHHQLTTLFLKFGLDYAKATKSDLNSINSFSKKKVAAGFWDNLHLKRTTMLRPGKFKETYDNFAPEAKTKKGFSWFREDCLNQKLGITAGNIKQGIFKKAYAVYVPFSNGLSDFFSLNPATKGLVSKMNAEANPVSKIIYSQMLDSAAIEPLRDCVEVEQRKEFSYFFTRKYSFFAGEKAHSIMPKDVSSNFSHYLDSAAEAIPDSIINQTNNLVFLESATESQIEEMKKNGIICLGECDALSVAKGEVIYRMNNEIMCSGIAIPSKKKRVTMDYESGQMTNIEKRVLRDYVEAVFDSTENAQSIVDTELSNIEQDLVSETDYISAVKVTEDSKNTTYRAKGRTGAEAVRMLDAKKDETLLYLMADSPDIPFLAYQPDKDRFYYIERTSEDGARHARRKYVSYNEKTKEFSNGLKIDKQEYLNKIFGRGSRLSRLIDAVSGSENRVKEDSSIGPLFETETED
jgi:hypothetical protein